MLRAHGRGAWLPETLPGAGGTAPAPIPAAEREPGAQTQLNTHITTGTFSEHPAHTQQDPNLAGLLPAAPGTHGRSPIPHQHPLRRPILLETSVRSHQAVPTAPGWQQFTVLPCKTSPVLSLRFPFLISILLYPSRQPLGLT